MAHFWQYFTATSSKHYCPHACRAQREQGRASQFDTPLLYTNLGDSCPSVLVSPCHSHAGTSQPPPGTPWRRAWPSQARELPGTAPLTFCLGFLGLLLCLLYLLFLACGIRSRVSPAAPFPGSLHLLLWDNCGTELGETQGSCSPRKGTVAQEAKGSSPTLPKGCSVLTRKKPAKINEIEGLINPLACPSSPLMLPFPHTPGREEGFLLLCSSSELQDWLRRCLWHFLNHICDTAGAFFHWREQHPHRIHPLEPELCCACWPQPERREEKEDSKDSKPCGRCKRRGTDRGCTHSTAGHGWSAGRRERSGRMKESHSPTREMQNTSTHNFSQEQREEIMKDAITTVIFLYPFFLF